MELWESLYQKYYKIWEQPKSNEDFIPVSKSLGENMIAAEKAVGTKAETKEERFDENVLQETPKVLEPETAQVLEPETPKVLVPETPKVLEPETPKVLEPETAKVLVPETPKVVEPETVVSFTESVQISQSESVVETKTESHHFESESHQVSNLESHQVSNTESHQTKSETDSVVTATEKLQISETETVYKTESLTNIDIAPVAETVAKLQLLDNKLEQPELQQKKEIHVKKDSSWIQNGIQQNENGFSQTNGLIPNGDSKKSVRPSNEIKMVATGNGDPKDVIRANDPPEDDLPKNIGVNKFVNFFESLGGKK